MQKLLKHVDGLRRRVAASIRQLEVMMIVELRPFEPQPELERDSVAVEIHCGDAVTWMVLQDGGPEVALTVR